MERFFEKSDRDRLTVQSQHLSERKRLVDEFIQMLVSVQPFLCCDVYPQSILRAASFERQTI